MATVLRYIGFLIALGVGSIVAAWLIGFALLGLLLLLVPVLLFLAAL